MDSVKITVTVNGRRHEREVEPRRLLSDFIREDLRLTGTHLGCEHGVCGFFFFCSTYSVGAKFIDRLWC